MLIDVSAAIMVGLPQVQIEHAQELLNDELLESCPPYYDSETDDEVITGFIFKESESYNAVNLEWNQKKIDELKIKFKEITGQDAKVWLSPMVC